jgi:DNA repair exonuclease SbcCD ATPase subunit
MNIEAEIQAEVDALRARFSDPKALYREVCTLLFFRHGITPTASKLYQFVRAGSMNTPTEALTRFWEDLRDKAGTVELDLPELPQALKASAAHAVTQIWREAASLARQETVAQRAEMQSAVEQAQMEQGRARRAAEDAAADGAVLKGMLAAAQDDARRQQAELEELQRTHADATARLHDLQQRLDQLQALQQQLLADSSMQIAAAREEADTATARAEAAERRAQEEAEQAHQARMQANREIDALRAQLSQAEGRLRQAARPQPEAMTLVQTQIDAAQPASAPLVQGQQPEALLNQADDEPVRSMIERIAPASPDRSLLRPAGTAKATTTLTRRAR